jgi:hypothetical protein
MLDLSHIILADHQIAKFATKREAKAFASSRGWNPCDIIQAFNRFNIFWVVAERTERDLRLATREPGTVHVPYRAAV